jgi:hypothetical protein
MEFRFPSGAILKDEHSWRVCDGVDEVRKTMRRVLSEQVDFVKIFTTGGVVSPQGSPFVPEWSPSELAVIVEEAQRLESLKVQPKAVPKVKPAQPTDRTRLFRRWSCSENSSFVLCSVS